MEVVVEEGEDVVALKFVATVEKIEFDYKSQTHDFRATGGGEFGGGFGGATGGQQVVHDDDALAFLDGIGVNF